MLTSWTPNTLPPPYEVVLSNRPANTGESKSAMFSGSVQPAVAVENVNVDENDLFPKGKVVKYYPHQGYGFVLDRTNKEIYFNVSEMDFVGSKGKNSIKLGSIVGYDVSWTSSGLHIKKIKVY